MIVINCTGSDTIELDELADFQGALKQRSAADVDKIIKSIKKHGFSFPFFVWAHDDINHVLDGHGRLAALKKMQADGEEIPALPCVYVEAENEAEAKEKLLKLNSQYGHMTAESVADFLDGMEIELDDLALPDGVLDLSGIAAPEEETEGDDDAPDVDEDGEPDSKPGEMYELGNSILLCGDSTNPEDVARLMGGEKADMVVTDPPYNVAYTGGMQIKDGHIASNGKKQIKNDEMDYTSFYNFLYDAYSNMKEYTKEKAALYVFYAHSQSRAFLNAFYDVGLKQRSIIIWHKTSGGFGDFMAQYMNAYEPCIYGSNGETVNWYGATNEKTVWDMDKEKKCDLHPTMKPVAVIQRAIRNSSKDGELILDLFGGSGTSLIAAEALGRRARIMELDPHYCDVIRKRWTKWAQENGRKVGSGGLE